MIKTADTVFPYLTSILSGHMTPEFAADQAEAAVNALCNKDEQTSEGPSEEGRMRYRSPWPRGIFAAASQR
jgi:hypothetical protein